MMDHKTFAILMTGIAAGWLASCKTPSQSETAPANWEVLGKEALARSHGTIDFTEHVKPVLEAKCLACHNTKTLPFFSMESRELAFAAGAAGPRIVPRHPEQSALITNATLAHARTMPPVGERLTEEEKRILTAWVAQGAPWPSGKAGALHPLSGSAH